MELGIPDYMGLEFACKGGTQRFKFEPGLEQESEVVATGVTERLKLFHDMTHLDADGKPLLSVEEYLQKTGKECLSDAEVKGLDNDFIASMDTIEQVTAVLDELENPFHDIEDFADISILFAGLGEEEMDANANTIAIGEMAFLGGKDEEEKPSQ